MKCLACGSQNLSQGEPQTYLAVSVSKLKSVWPKAYVCLDCGTVLFRFAEPELKELRAKSNSPAE